MFHKPSELDHNDGLVQSLKTTLIKKGDVIYPDKKIQRNHPKCSVVIGFIN